MVLLRLPSQVGYQFSFLPWKELKLITDDESCILIVRGLLFEQKVTLVNLYMPNEDQVSSLEIYLHLVHQQGVSPAGGRGLYYGVGPHA